MCAVIFYPAATIYLLVRLFAIFRLKFKFERLGPGTRVSLDEAVRGDANLETLESERLFAQSC